MEWEVGHCNDPNRLVAQYAIIQKDGALTCVDCPHPIGANCLTLDITWDGVYANPGYWTDGTRKDTYYKCPYKKGCLGGKTELVEMNGTIYRNTTKSRCEIGFEGVVCAICRPGYYFSDENCIICPDSKEESQLFISLMFGGLFVFFISILLHTMQIKDSKQQWKQISVHVNANVLTKESNNTRQKMKNMKDFFSTASATVKIFIGFIQIISVCDTAFKIPWTYGFLT